MNEEIRMTNESSLRHSSFGLDSSFWFRHSGFVPPFRFRQLDAEHRPAAVRCFDGDASTHALDAAADDRQAHANAGIALGGGEALEKLKDALMVAGLDADPVVLNAQRYSAVAFSGADLHRR